MYAIILNLKKRKDMEKFLEARIGARYWEDSILNGIEDKDKKMPCIVNEFWCPIIDLSTGKIVNWDIGNEADIHYKSADCNDFYLLDENKSRISKYEECYVIDSMCPDGDGYGDYVIMKINKDGLIKNFTYQDEELEWENI